MARSTQLGPQPGPAVIDESGLESLLGGTRNDPTMPGVSIGPQVHRVLRLELNQTPSGWQEYALLGVPQQALSPAPLLVLFHGLYESPELVLEHTPLVRAAMNRGWYVAIPLGANLGNYGIDYAQDNVELALTYVAQNFPIDVHRIYSVGYSMGGGHALSYAARHQDPNGLRFAAVVNHTGTTSLAHVHSEADPSSNIAAWFESPQMFGAAPSQIPFDYARVSSIVLDPATGAVGSQDDMVRNLVHTPVRHAWSDADQNVYILEETIATHQHLLLLGGNTTRAALPNGNHTWDTLDVQATLDWLGQNDLTDPAQKPSAGQFHNLLVDREATWGSFAVTPAMPGVFTPISWMYDPNQNEVHLVDMKNVAQVRIDPVELGLDPLVNLDVHVSLANPGAVDIVVEGVTSFTTIQRNGANIGGWSWDQATGTLAFTESNPQVAPVWTIN